MSYTTAFAEAHYKDMTREDLKQQNEMENKFKNMTLQLTERGQNIDMAMKQMEIAASERNSIRSARASGAGAEKMTDPQRQIMAIFRADDRAYGTPGEQAQAYKDAVITWKSTGSGGGQGGMDFGFDGGGNYAGLGGGGGPAPIRLPKGVTVTERK